MVTKFEFVQKGERIMTEVVGGVCLKPAPEDGVLFYADETPAPLFMSMTLVAHMSRMFFPHGVMGATP